MTMPALNCKLPCNLFLIGYRGTGKSTVASILAAELGWKCVDADGLLEAKAGMSIREIFELEGEAGFRLRESELLGEICGGSQQVVATGGGVILDRRNRERLIASGVCVLLEADV